MVITLPLEIEHKLNELADKQETTIELLALSAIKEKFIYNWIPKIKNRESKVETLAERLAPYIGVISSTEFVKGGANMSVNTGKKFIKRQLTLKSKK
jgi:hypothetical protein